MIKRLLWVGIGATAGWLGNQKYQETKTHVQRRIADKGLAFSIDVAKQSAGFVFHNLKALIVEKKTDQGTNPGANPGAHHTPNQSH
ncbi:hypothetical protein [Micrococcoides hystricis]|uniref:DUF1490 family protein n=1 Tax=Micrococcoides hystricis TaxID=1572761 RepID=A0ABV6P7Q5_9MICC